MGEQTWADILDDDERLLWQGQPKRQSRFGGQDVVGVLMGLFFMGFSVVWMYMASMAGGPFWMFGLIFFFVGLYNAIGRWVWEPLLKGRTWYALSTKRAFIAVDHPLRGRSLRSFPIGPDTDVSFEQGKHHAIWFTSERVSGRSGTVSRRIGFDMLEDGRDVMRHFRAIQEGSA